MASKSFTVSEYSDTVVNKYLQHAFSDNPQENLTSAAEEIYVLLRKLMDAANPVDVKAPLKSIRDGIEGFASSPGSKPEVEELFCLYSRLQELCVERTFNGTDPAGAEQVQDVLRYRLTRLLVGDTWDARPALKLRVLQLIFSFMVRENERLLEEGRDVPSLKLALGRSLSIGRRGSRDLGPRRHSKWQDALSEVGRMQGAKLLPIVKLLLMENMQLADAAGASAVSESAPQEGSPATPGKLSPTQQPSESSGAPFPAGAPPANLDDLLGLNVGFSEPGDEAPSRRSSSPAVSTPGDDPFAALAEGRHANSYFPGSQGDPAASSGAGQETPHVTFSNMSISSGGGAAGVCRPRPGSPSGSLSSTNAGSMLPGVQTPPGYQQPPYFMTGGPAQPALIAAAHPGGYHPAAPAPYGSYPGNNLQSYGSGPLPPMSSPRQTYGSGSSPSPGSATGGAYAGFLSPQQASNHTKPASSSFPANFDANSPYLGQPHPFEDSSFKDISPVSRSHNSVPSPPHAPPMRTDSK